MSTSKIRIYAGRLQYYKEPNCISIYFKIKANKQGRGTLSHETRKKKGMLWFAVAEQPLECLLGRQKWDLCSGNLHSNPTP